MSGTTIPRGNCIRLILLGATITPASVAATITAEQTFTVMGLRTTDFVDVQPSTAISQTAGTFVAGARVSAANTLSVAFANVTAGALTPAAGLYEVLVSRPENLPLPTSTV